MTIAEVKGRLDGINTNYNSYVLDKNATNYDSSRLFKEVDEFNQYIHTKIINEIDSFADVLRSIEIDATNYKNTVSKIGDLKQSIAEGRMAIDNYNTSISRKAIEVFNEYNERFGAFGRLYENNKTSAEKLIDLAQDAENKSNNPPYYTKKDSQGNEVADTAARAEYQIRWSNKRDTYLKQADSQVDYMKKNKDSMIELLEKGLKKV